MQFNLGQLNKTIERKQNTTRHFSSILKLNKWPIELELIEQIDIEQNNFDQFSNWTISWLNTIQLNIKLLNKYGATIEQGSNRTNLKLAKLQLNNCVLNKWTCSKNYWSVVIGQLSLFSCHCSVVMSMITIIMMLIMGHTFACPRCQYRSPRLQSWSKKRALGCVNSPPRGQRESRGGIHAT